MGRKKKIDKKLRYTIMIEPDILEKLEYLAKRKGIVKGIYLRAIVRDHVLKDFSEIYIDMVKKIE